MQKITPKSTLNRLQIDPILGTTSLSWRQHGPTWAVPAPTWRQLNPSWAYPGDNFSRNPCPKSRKTPPKHPKPFQNSLNHDFGRFSARQTNIFTDFLSAFQLILAYVFNAFDKPLTKKLLYQNATSMT